MEITIDENRLMQLAIHLVCIKETYYFESTIPPEEYLNCCDDENIGELVPLIFQPFLELPFLFPDEWYSDTFSMPMWVEDDSEQETIASIMSFFGLSHFQFFHLFCIGGQHPEIFGGKILNDKTCNSQTIGRNIAELIRKVKFIESDLMKNINLN
ncbi:MAG: hypothetical protein Q8L90_10770 [Bacteroidota bacterium]|nr:hypothetical protein [Bacteroidota bacterium]